MHETQPRLGAPAAGPDDVPICDATLSLGLPFIVEKPSLRERLAAPLPLTAGALLHLALDSVGRLSIS
jgi:hypothetical protein